MIVKNYTVVNYKNKNLCFAQLELPINWYRDFPSLIQQALFIASEGFFMVFRVGLLEKVIIS